MWFGVVVGLVVTFTVLIWPWVAAASVGGFDQAAWQAVHLLIVCVQLPRDDHRAISAGWYGPRRDTWVFE
jgi:hypothetical protein